MSTSENTFGLGVVGCGGRIRHVLKTILAQDRRIRVVALMDPSGESIQAARQELDAPQAKVYKDAAALAADPQVQWVFIGSWNCFHKDQAIAALRAGKHVFLEKPLVTSVADGRALTKVRAQHPGQIFCVGFTLRFSPHYRKIKELVEQGAIGQLITMEFNETLHFDHGGAIHGNWRRLTRNAGSHLLEKCCHDIDLMQWITGSRPSAVASFGGLDFFVPRNKKHMDRLSRHPELGHQAYLGHMLGNPVNPFTSKKDIMDNQVAIMQLESGARAVFHTNANTAILERRMYLCGTEGTLRADVIPGTIELQRIGYDEPLQRLDTGAMGGHGGGDEVLAGEIAQAITQGVEPLSRFHDGLQAAAICFGIDQACASGRTVDMSKLYSRMGL